MLNFLGVGSAFNTSLGNNSAYFKTGNSLFLIDCGGAVFPRMQELDLFKGVSNLHVALTHTHPDHVGSLGDVIFYCYYVLRFKPRIFFPEKELLEMLLACIGVGAEMYVLGSDRQAEIDDDALGVVSLEFRPVPHVETIPCYGIVIRKKDGAFYYSGDANDIEGDIVSMLRSGELDVVYQDTCGLDYEENNHMSLRKLADRIEPQIRERVFCMHLDRYINLEDIIKLGFVPVMSV